MRFHMLRTIYQKEMLDLLRDRRTLISMLVIPMLLLPLLMTVTTRGILLMQQKSQQQAKSVSVAAKVADPTFVEALREAGLQVKSSDNPRALIEQKKASAGVEETAGDGAAPNLQIYADASSPTSAALGMQIRTALEAFREKKVRETLRSSGVPEGVLMPFRVTRVNVAPPRKMAGMVWGTVLGYMLLLMMFSGGMYPVIDMTAGEKERKTLEAFLATPAGRGEIVWGKTLAAMTAILVTAMVTLAGMVAALRLNRNAASGELHEFLTAVPLDGQTIIMIALTLLPLCVFAASVMLAIAMFARSFKEGQSYLTPLMMLVIFPAMLGGLPGLELTPVFYLIPIFNASQIIRSILLGDVSSTAFTITMVSNIVYAVIAAIVARRRFENENVLFRS